MRSNKQAILLLLLICIGANCSAQKDTLYFDANWKKTDKTNASFFRPIPLQKEGDLYHVRDYYINGNVQMQGSWSDVKSETLHGKIIWYAQNGNKTVESEYNNGVLEGLSNVYRKGGQLKASGVNKNNAPFSGSFIVYRLLQNYKDGILNGEEISYAENGKIATTGINKNGKRWIGEFTNSQIQKTTYKEGRNDGVTTSYYDLNFEQKKQYYTIVNGKKEGKEVSYALEGEEIANGTNKDDMAWNGSFYNQYLHTLISYKEGKFHGSLITYNLEGKIISNNEYKNGKISGRVISTGFFKSKRCECDYQDENPYNGEECKGYDVYQYLDGQLTKLTSYKNELQEDIEEIQFFENKVKTKKIVYLDGEAYELIYKNDKAYSGQDYNRLSDNLTTIIDGVKEGPFRRNEKYKGYTVSGNYKHGAYDGKIKFYNLQNKATTFCTYRDGKPLDGTAIYKDTIISYKKGLKHGLETPIEAYGAYSSPFDSISRNYEFGKLEGAIKFFEESNEIGKGVYKNNSPFTGVFYSYSKGATYYTVNTYDQGQQLKSEYVSRIYRNEHYFKNNALDKGNYYVDNKLIATGQFKNEEPYSGSFALLEKIDKGSFPEKYTLSYYKKGKKEGKERVINFHRNTVEERTDYQKGNILRKVVFLPFKAKDSLVGRYKKNKPFSGDFVNTLASNNAINDFKSSYQSLSHYESGQKSGMEYYTTNGSNFEVVLDSVGYKNGKPFQGNLLEVYNGETLLHCYESGTLAKTNSYTWGLSKKPHFIVTYTEKGYKIANTRPSQNVTNYTSEVIYSSTDHSEGKAIISSKEKEIGHFSFSKNGITDAQFSFIEHGTNATIQSSDLNKITLVFDLENMRIKFESTLKTLPNIKPNDIQNWQRIFFFGDGPASFYLNGEESPTATCMYKEGRELNGITANVNKNGTHNFNLYKNGELIQEQKNLTKEQLLLLIKSKQ